MLEVTVEQDQGPIGQGKVVLLRRSEQPEGTFRQTPGWAAPAPGPELGSLPSGTDGRGLGRDAAGPWAAPWQAWAVSGSAGPGRAACGSGTSTRWSRARSSPRSCGWAGRGPGQPADQSSDRGLPFINADYTVYLGREPQGEYLGIQPYGHISERGVGAGEAVAHDVAGPLGFIATTAVANT